MMLEITKATTVKVNRIKSLDMIIFAVFTIYEYEYQLQPFDAFLLPSLLFIKGNFKNEQCVCKMLMTWCQDMLSDYSIMCTRVKRWKQTYTNVCGKLMQ